jgi:hypothetical protein
MPNRAQLRGICHWFSISFLVLFLATLMPSQKAYGQGLELSGGWAHMTENNGTDGFEVGAAWWFNRRVTLAANYDSAWDTSSLTNFSLTSIGLVTTHSRIQNALIGPRIFFSSKWSDKYKLNPFGEAQFGNSWLNQKATVGAVPSVSANDNAFSYLVGGGVEYLFGGHWSGRVDLGLLRTHFANEGQSHVRFVLGGTYTLGKRGPG